VGVILMFGVMGDDGDVAGVFEDGDAAFVGAGAAAGAESGAQFVHGHATVTHGAVVDLAVVDEDDGVAFDPAFEAFAFEGEETDEVVKGNEGAGTDDAAGDGVVAAVHRVLDGVAEDEEEDEVERCELADLTFAGDAEEEQDEGVNDGAAEDEFPPGEAGVPHGQGSFCGQDG